MEGIETAALLKNYWTVWNPGLFCRAHRSYLVILPLRESSLVQDSYHLRNGYTKQSEIPVSRAQTNRLRELSDF